MKKSSLLIAILSTISVLAVVVGVFFVFQRDKASEYSRKILNISIFSDSFKQMADEEVLLSVGAETLKKSDVLANITLLLKLSENRVGQPLNEERKSAIAHNVLRGLFGQFVEVNLVHAITKTNAMVRAEEVAAREKNFYASFLRSNDTYEGVLEKLTAAERDVVRRTVTAQLELDDYLQRNCSNEMVVTEQQIDAAMARVKAWNDMIATTNAFAYATASNIVKWVAAGQDFGKLADKYSQDPEKKPGGMIDDHAAVWFCNGRTSYLDVLDQMPPGKVSDILESTEGLLIVKALGKDKNGTPLYQRIVLQKGEPYPNYTRKDMRVLGENELLTAQLNRLKEISRKVNQVTYPHGEDYFNAKNHEGGLVK